MSLAPFPVEGFSRYRVSSEGKVYAVHLNRYLTNNNNGTGYIQVKVRDDSGNRKNFYVHRLVALFFVPNDKGLDEVNHIDSDRANNCSDNLEWTTRSANMIHARDNGRLRGHIGCTCGICLTCEGKGIVN